MSECTCVYATRKNSSAVRKGYVMSGSVMMECDNCKARKAQVGEGKMSEFTQYRRTAIAEMRPYVNGENLSERVSISAADKENGSPKAGDMIARNPKNHDDQWLIAADYFADNFAPMTAQPQEQGK